MICGSSHLRNIIINKLTATAPDAICLHGEVPNRCLPLHILLANGEHLLREGKTCGWLESIFNITGQLLCLQQKPPLPVAGQPRTVKIHMLHHESHSLPPTPHCHKAHLDKVSSNGDANHKLDVVVAASSNTPR